MSHRLMRPSQRRPYLAALFTAAAFGAVTLGAAPASARDTAMAVLSTAKHRLYVQQTCLDSLHINAGINAGAGEASTVPEGIAFRSNGTEAVLEGSSCSGTMTVQVGLDTAVILSPSDTNVTVDGPLAPVVARTGDGNLTVSHASALVLQAAGDGDVSVGTLTGPAAIVSSGSGDIRIGTAAVPELNVLLGGSSDLTVGGGFVGSLAVLDTGSGDARMHGVTGDAYLAALGSGSIRTSMVTGSVQRRSGGMGSVAVGHANGSVSASRGVFSKGGVSLADGTELMPDAIRTANGTVISASAISGTWAELLTPHLDATAVPEPPAPPAPPAVPEPPAPAVPTVVHAEDDDSSVDITTDGSHVTVHRGHAHRHDDGLSGGFVVLMILLGLTVMFRRRIFPPLVRWLEQRGYTAERAPLLLKPFFRPPPVVEPEVTDPRVLALRERLHSMEPRLAKLEGFVTSRDFHLYRQFRDLDRDSA